MGGNRPTGKSHMNRAGIYQVDPQPQRVWIHNHNEWEYGSNNATATLFVLC